MVFIQFSSSQPLGSAQYRISEYFGHFFLQIGSLSYRPQRYVQSPCVWVAHYAHTHFRGCVFHPLVNLFSLEIIELKIGFLTMENNILFMNIKNAAQHIGLELNLDGMNAVFCNSTVKGCLFHYTQTNWRNVVNHVLERHEEIGRDIQKLVALPFIPSDDSEDTFDGPWTPRIKMCKI